jgi:SAM-dependent methyltransferase
VLAGGNAFSSSARDQAVAEDVRETLAANPSLRSLDLVMEVRGGVVHIRGRVWAEEDRRHLRRVLGRIRGVLAVWDALQLDGRPAGRVLDIGCGGTKQWTEAIGLDLQSLPGVDVVADLEAALPFHDGRFEHVFAIHVLEHVHDLGRLMAEIQRVLGPCGVLHAVVPRWDVVNAIADPTHLRLFHPQTFKYFCVPRAGRTLFRPLLVTCDDASVFADLQPVTADEPPPDATELARFFR